jgi:hypothetical protein
MATRSLSLWRERERERERAQGWKIARLEDSGGAIERENSGKIFRDGYHYQTDPAQAE